MKYKLRGQFSTNADEALDDLLAARGVKDIEGFKHPNAKQELDPYLLENIGLGADLLLKHLRKKHSILFVMDCDDDGLFSTSIFWLYIKSLFPDAYLDVTVHEGKQHGLQDKAQWIVDENQVDLVVLPDAGSFDFKEQQLLNSYNIDVLVCDHHEAPVDENGDCLLPPTTEHLIVVNNQLSPRYENKSLCGAGMALKFCEVLDDKLGVNIAHNFMDLAAIGEIADVMDKRNIETNYIITEGLKNIKNKGLRVLIESQSYSLKQKAIYPYTGLTSTDIAFYIAPSLNAIHRLGSLQEKRVMFECFTDPDKLVPSTKRGHGANEMETAAEQTARVGANRKNQQNRLCEQAENTLDYLIQKENLDENNVLVVELNDNCTWPASLNGLVAMRIVSKYKKPCLLGRVNDDGNFQGSMRSDTNYANLPSFKEFLEHSNLMNYTLGHSFASGISLPLKNVPALIEYANTTLKASDFENCYRVDYILDARDDNYDLIYEISDHSEYWGNGLDEPRFIIQHIPLENVTQMGPNKDSTKIVYNAISYIKFKDLKFVEEIAANRMTALTVYARANQNEYPPNSGNISLQFFIEDYEFEDNARKAQIADMGRYEF